MQSAVEVEGEVVEGIRSDEVVGEQADVVADVFKVGLVVVVRGWLRYIQV